MQVVLIGRDGTNDTLKISTNGKSVNGPKVTKTMSREHCRLTINDDGTATIENINPRNVTFVNGQPVMSKVISGTDVVELGGDRYKLDLAPFKLAKFADIRHLEIIWKRHKQYQEKQKIDALRKNALRSATGILTMGAILISFANNPDLNFLRYTLYILAIISIGWTVVSGIINAPKIVKKENEMKQRFQESYVCPNCGMFLGFEKSFDMLRKDGECYKCHTKFRY